MNPVVVALALIFSQLSLLAFGGGNTIVPEMQRQMVEVHHWITAETFSSLFALSQAAPGPNLMIIPLLGWHIAGWEGMVVSALAGLGPSSLLTLAVMSVWERFREKPWRRIVQTGIVPVSIGLVGASAVLITVSADSTWWLAAISVVCVVVALNTRLHPMWMLFGGGLAGIVLGNVM
jgi:chromate transporter